MQVQVPHRIETRHLVLRPWCRNDAEALKDAIESSLDHLRAWLPWANHEPESLASKRERITRGEAEFAAGNRHVYGLFDPSEQRILGCVALEPVTDATGPVADPARARELGYWMRVDAAGRGLMQEAVGALTRAGFLAFGFEHLEIQCDPENAASAAIPRRLGYRLAETRYASKTSPAGEPRDTMIWVMQGHELAQSPCARVRLRAFDRGGAPITALHGDPG